MTAQQKIAADTSSPVGKEKTGLDLLREPFPPNQVSKLPKPTKKQNDEVKQDFKKGIRCQQCGQWHHPQVQHLDYVGHAALTDRLLDCDPNWNWEPVAFGDRGTPLMDENGGMWIKLTVCGQTRLGYGHPDGKRGGDAIKEVIGDALRNAAMRFGAALDLWHKGELHAAPEEPTADEAREDVEPEGQQQADPEPQFNPRAAADRLITAIRKRAGDRPALQELWDSEKQTLSELPDELFDEVKREFSRAAPKADPAPDADLGGDEIPY